MKINPSLEAGSLPLSGSAELLPAAQADFPQGYRLPDDCTDPNLIQRYIAAQMGRTVEACLEIGRGLSALKTLCQHGEFLNRLGELGLNTRVAQRFMAAFRRLSGSTFGPLLSAAGKQTKLFELLSLADAQLEALALKGQVGPLHLSELPAMTVSGLREAVQQCREVQQPLAPDDRIESLHARRKGKVVKVYADGSACVCWDDGEPQGAGLGHERIPREGLVKISATSAATDHDALLVVTDEASNDSPQQTPEPSEVAVSVDAILSQAALIGNHASEDARSAIQLGWILIVAKRQVPPGHFCEFITKTLGISQCVASRMMKAAMLFPDIDRHPEICELGFSKLTELLWEDELAVRGLVDGGTLAGYSLADFKAMTVREVRHAIKGTAPASKDETSGADDPGEQRKAYLVARVAMLVRFAEEAELNTLDDVLDELVGEISNSRFEPGLVAEDYVLTHRFLLNGGVK